ncbi:MAG: cadmium-translocating P-type ATPase [Chloroflexi bacterium]|nr:cadmium-translocating P-type ATPase [Chloroflexota bacterium]MCC6894592.1 cadmium-translocating P-type ATPase [Anaerolineae bacterium]
MEKRILQFIRENPIPFLALFGLALGAVVRFGAGRVDLADLIWLATLVIGGAPVVYETTKGMLKGDFASDVVAMLAIIAAVLTQEYFAGVIIVLMQSGGEALESYSLRRASSSLEKLLARAPRTAHRRTDTRIEDIQVEQVQIGDTLVVRPGDLIPVDGKLLSAQAEVDEAALTGEPLAAPKKAGGVLLSGSVNVGDAFEMQASQLSVDSKYAKIVELVRKAQEEKPPLQRLADRYAVWFTPVTLVMCALGWLITGNPHTILSVLVVATPCPLILAVPVAIISGINRAASFGIIVKGGTAIEQIGRAQAIVFDKTGTLTYGKPTVQKIIPFNGRPPVEIMRLAGGAEQLSGHVLAQSLAQAALKQNGALPMPTHVHEVAGHGIEAEVEGHHIAIGSPKFIADTTGRAIEPERLTDSELSAYISIDCKPAGVVSFSDQLRPGVPDLMTRLRGLGINHIAMLTGDRASHARKVAQAAHLDSFEAGLLPEDKVTAVNKLKQKYNSIVMVGDGINDAPALATATVGVAMGAHGTGISAEAADIVLMVDDVSRVADAVETGQRMVRVAKQSIYVGLGLSLGLMVLAALGVIPPAVGALLQEAIDVAVIVNGLRAR